MLAFSTIYQTNIQDTVIELCSDILKTDKYVRADQLYFAVGTTKMLQKEKLTYCGTIMANWKGFSSDVNKVS